MSLDPCRVAIRAVFRTVYRDAHSEAPVGIEPTVGDLQSPALPLGDGALLDGR